MKRPRAPFLTYLTVFKSRIGVANMVLAMTDFAFLPQVTLSRRLEEHLRRKVLLAIDDAQCGAVLEYLAEKKLVGRTIRDGGRYNEFTLRQTNGRWVVCDRQGKSIDQIPVFQTDVWMSDAALRSTIGVPTPDNTDEILELCFQLGLLSPVKCSWTAAGQLTRGLRLRNANSYDNPFRLGLEGVALLRQIISVDGLLMHQLVEFLANCQGTVRRDDLTSILPELARKAFLVAKKLQLAPPLLAEGKKFISLLEDTEKKDKAAKKRGSEARGPGVLEHRISPRLEWLVDVGILSKAGLTRNGFEYVVTGDARTFLDGLGGDIGDPYWADDAALTYLRNSEHFSHVRQELQPLQLRAALYAGYLIMRRSVGPTPIREVCMAGAALAPHLRGRISNFVDEIVAWASSDAKISVSGGRYSRKPELVHIAGEPRHME